MKHACYVVCLVGLFTVFSIAEDKKSDRTPPNVDAGGGGKAPAGQIHGPDAEADKFGLVAHSYRSSRSSVDMPGDSKNLGTRNILLAGALWTATGLDIHSSYRLDTGYHEANVAGSLPGQLATSLCATGAAFFIQRYGPRRMRWLSSALLAGGAVAHAAGAIHNYRLK